MHFSTIAINYDAFIVDLWGVIHDGHALYPGALGVLEWLYAEDKRVVFLSNAPRPAVHVRGTMDRLGVPRHFYEAIVTSGEVAHAYLAQPEQQARWGRKCLYPGIETESYILDGLPYEMVRDPALAEFVIMAGYDYFGQPFAEMQPRLQRALERSLPMLCINPDVEVVRLDGSSILCAGHLAEWYAAQGGKVEWIGKPYPMVYAHCLQLLKDVTKEKILAIGDNLATDIAGGQRAGLATLLVESGVRRNQASLAPDYVLSGLSL
jgi:HAD superfamily hydrolase (TIGR01459 family)